MFLLSALLHAQPKRIFFLEPMICSFQYEQRRSATVALHFRFHWHFAFVFCHHFCYQMRNFQTHTRTPILFRCIVPPACLFSLLLPSNFGLLFWNGCDWNAQLVCGRSFAFVLHFIARLFFLLCSHFALSFLFWFFLFFFSFYDFQKAIQVYCGYKEIKSFFSKL